MVSAAQALCEIAPEMDAEKACELMGVTLEDVLAELEYRKRQREARMRTEMALAAKAGGRRRIMRSGEQGAYVDMMIHPVSYHYWGQRLGYHCWDDPKFVAEYKRDNPEARVKQDNVRTFSMAATPAPRPRDGEVRYLVNGKPQSRDDRLTIKVA